MRKRSFPVALAAVCALATAGVAPATQTALATQAQTPCASRPDLVSAIPFTWYAAPVEDADALEPWCRGVGAPVIAATPDVRAGAPRLEQLVIVSWNVHLAEGRLTELIGDLRGGALTNGEPVDHFVLLLQELYRRGDEVPAFGPNSRSAFAINSRNPDAPDAADYARELGLALAYVPSMRNGAQMAEDRGNAIVSTEPLTDLFAFELPFERQRRVAAGAAIAVRTEDGLQRLQLVDAHLEPLAAPSSLWLFRNPRRRQMAALLDLLQQPRFARDSVGTVLGGDFNTVQGGAREEVYRHARAWSRSLTVEDPRPTHLLGRLDYVFARLAPGWHVDTTRVTEKYGSDHHPVLARFRR
ncbi:MAG TPA: endonuclease/exonuclease/phosphatase family protein [Vicinamibacterales bacterium]|nr:endonuclease/exonuclease/phosphatase family protein [Vicinamibacterales bacterium]